MQNATECRVLFKLHCCTNTNSSFGLNWHTFHTEYFSLFENVTERSVLFFRFPALQLFEEVHTFTLLLTNGVLPHKSFWWQRGHLDSLEVDTHVLRVLHMNNLAILRKRQHVFSNKLAKLGDAIAISKSETNHHSLH